MEAHVRTEETTQGETRSPLIDDLMLPSEDLRGPFVDRGHPTRLNRFLEASTDPDQLMACLGLPGVTGNSLHEQIQTLLAENRSAIAYHASVLEQTLSQLHDRLRQLHTAEGTYLAANEQLEQETHAEREALLEEYRRSYLETLRRSMSMSTAELPSTIQYPLSFIQSDAFQEAFNEAVSETTKEYNTRKAERVEQLIAQLPPDVIKTADENRITYTQACAHLTQSGQHDSLDLIGVQDILDEISRIRIETRCSIYNNEHWRVYDVLRKVLTKGLSQDGDQILSATQVESLYCDNLFESIELYAQTMLSQNPPHRHPDTPSVNALYALYNRCLHQVEDILEERAAHIDAINNALTMLRDMSYQIPPASVVEDWNRIT